MENRWLDDVDVDDREARAAAEKVSDDAKKAIQNRAAALLSADSNADLSKDDGLYDLIVTYSDSVLEYSKEFDGDYLDPPLHEIVLGEDSEGETWKVSYVVFEEMRRTYARYVLSHDDEIYA